MKENKFIFSIAILFIAVLAWVGVGVLAWRISVMQDTRASILDSLDQSTARKTAAARTHAILQETVREREKLVRISDVDVISVVNALEAIGPLAGVTLQVRGAQPGVAIQGKAGAKVIRPIHFTVQIDGSFAGVTRAIQLIEKFPFPITIPEFDIARTALDEQKQKSVATWHVNVNLKLLTTSDVSS